MLSARHPHRRPLRLAAITLLGALTAGSLTACAGGSAEVPEFDPATLCQTVDTSATLPACTAAFADGAAIRIPTSPTDTGVFGVIAAHGEADVTLIDADGKTHAVAEDTVQTLAQKMQDATPDETYANIVFYGTLDGNTITTLTPVATVDTTVILNTVFGGKTLEGTISTWEGGEYAMEPTLPVQITLNDHATKAGTGYVLNGVITNATAPVKLSDGASIPALTDAATRNPLQDTFTANINIQRVPSMHSAFDDELVLAWTDSSSGMGAEFYPTIATAAGLTPIRGEWFITQHGTPTAGPALSLSLAS